MGTYQANAVGTNGWLPFESTWSSGSWSGQALPVLGTPGMGDEEDVTSIGCGPHHCAAVGLSELTSPPAIITETLVNGQWAVNSLPAPATGFRSFAQPLVSCGSSTSCILAASYERKVPGSSITNPLYLAKANLSGFFTTSHLTGPIHAAGDNFYSLSCSTGSTCIVAGRTGVAVGGNDQALAVGLHY